MRRCRVNASRSLNGSKRSTAIHLLCRIKARHPGGQALVLGAKAGVDPSIVLKVLGGGYAQTRVMDVRGPKVIQGQFEPGFKSRLHHKDLNIALQTARDLHVPLPATALAQQLFSALLAAGRGDLDHSAIITIFEDLAGIQARTPLAPQLDG